jgi:hypothetical protein
MWPIRNYLEQRRGPQSCEAATLTGRPWSAKTVIQRRMLRCRADAIAGGRRHEPIERPHLAIREADARAAVLAPKIAEIRASGVTSMRGIAMALNTRNIPTTTGREKWQAVQVRRLLARM